ncbi:hypothetical protein [Rhodococcus opacus]|uniref:hypothetical protein n=1 Tax=Rhodococcus opacus TaxID=37919 RepID=UPI0022362662|nr:hypothetical protein [Rhodococcus opacus]
MSKEWVRISGRRQLCVTGAHRRRRSHLHRPTTGGRGAREEVRMLVLVRHAHAGEKKRWPGPDTYHP